MTNDKRDFEKLCVDDCKQGLSSTEMNNTGCETKQMIGMWSYVVF